MKSLVDDPDSYLATAAELLAMEGMTEAVGILRSSRCRVEETGFDSWNGGTRHWTIYLLLEPRIYARYSATIWVRTARQSG